MVKKDPSLCQQGITIVTDPKEIAKAVSTIESSSAFLEYPSCVELGVVFSDQYLEVRRDPVRFPNGKYGTYLRITERAAVDGIAGVILLPVSGETIFLVESYRHATQSWEIELPRGSRPKGFTALENVQQEIFEEIGLEIEETVDLGLINPNSALLSGAARAFLVRLKPGIPKPDPNDTEAIRRILQVEPSTLWNLIRDGKIKDAFTLSSIQLAVVKRLIPQPKPDSASHKSRK